MSAVAGSLPKELEPLREWLEARRPYKDQTLEEVLNADTSVFINPARAVAERAFQDAVWTLRDAIGEHKLSIRRRVRERPVEAIDPHDPPVRWPKPKPQRSRKRARLSVDPSFLAAARAGRFGPLGGHLDVT